MLSAGMLREEVDVIIELVSSSRMEEARQRLELLRPQVKSDYGRGALLALDGLMSSGKTNTGAPDREKQKRAGERVLSTQWLDDADRGYFQTFLKFMKKVKQPEPKKASDSAPPA